ncbi:hypothetical protein CBR_g30995 [Chara braunii]|uniref:Uncharacterized protein n=1 Tax=Chara braunii TaxID=69332 RepID=A0A388LE03_CHABU|nr:hypothetical protein CBR_g30995 [Chara braunii]|eukprot:GBG80534.1 hypothetical protein CBR_g30995 [Chara braunii]
MAGASACCAIAAAQGASLALSSPCAGEICGQVDRGGHGAEANLLSFKWRKTGAGAGAGALFPAAGKLSSGSATSGSGFRRSALRRPKLGDGVEAEAEEERRQTSRRGSSSSRQYSIQAIATPERTQEADTATSTTSTGVGSPLASSQGIATAGPQRGSAESTADPASPTFLPIPSFEECFPSSTKEFRRGGYGKEEEDVDEEDKEEEESRWRRRDGRREKRKGRRRTSRRRRRHGWQGRVGHEKGEDTRKGRRRGGMEDEEVRGGGGDEKEKGGGDMEDEEGEKEQGHWILEAPQESAAPSGKVPQK